MSLGDALIGRIRRHGSIPFSEFMEAALYDPEHGYYASGTVRTGWSGDFVTSPQLDPAFGRLWARALHDFWQVLGLPAKLHVTEIGGGEGALAAALLDSLPRHLDDIVTYELLERVPRVRERQEALLATDPRVVWSESFGALPQVEARVVFANEVLDNVPVDLLEMHDGAFYEVLVGERDGVLVEEMGGKVPPPDGVEPAALGEGHRLEVRPGARDLIRDATSRTARGILVLIDYGYSSEEIPQRPDGSIASYSRLGMDDRPLESPGSKDITAHVDWSATAFELTRAGLRVAGPHPQDAVLRALGAAELDRSLQEEHERALSDKRGADAVALLSRRHALRALLDPQGLGRFQVMLGLKDVPEPAFLTDI